MDREVEPQRHEKLYFTDGNVAICAAGKGSQPMVFRVHQTLLSVSSTVFEDMFASSTPTADEVFDGHPVVRLTDSPTDLAHLLRVLLPNKHRR